MLLLWGVQTSSNNMEKAIQRKQYPDPMTWDYDEREDVSAPHNVIKSIVHDILLLCVGFTMLLIVSGLIGWALEEIMFRNTIPDYEL